MLRIVLFCIFPVLLFSCSDDEDSGNGGNMNPSTTTPTVSISNFTVEEGNQDKSFFVSVNLNTAADEEVLIFIESEDDTAEAGQDYEAISTAVSFAAGSIQEDVKVTVFGDEDSEFNETFKLNIVNTRGADIGVGTAVITIENDDAGNAEVIIPATGYATPETYDGMNLLWSDEFDTESLNRDFWTYEIGNGSSGWGNNELQFYREQNTTMVDGNLVITARQEPFGGFQYTSSRLITKNKFEFTHGRVDIRAVLPEGQGIWPALWMLGENIDQVSWPRCGEIDIMEIVGHQPSVSHGTVHYANTSGQHIFTGKSYSLSNNAKFSDEYHVFSVEWEEDRIRFYVDDNLYYTVTPQILGTSNPYPFNDPFFFIFNVAVGGNWPGSPDGTTRFPQHMVVDYIRVFQPN